jgi:hypothetical protein
MPLRPSKRRRTVGDALDHFAEIGLIETWIQATETTVAIWLGDGTERLISGLTNLELLCATLAIAEAARPADAGEPRYTRAEVKENLVIVSDIAYRLDVAVSTVATWPERYGDWPEPLVLGAQQRLGSHGRQAVYWWPEILAFLARHDLPGGHPGRKNSTADGGLAGHDGPPHRHDSDGQPSY